MFDAEAVRAKIAAFASARVPSLAAGRALLAVSGGADSIATAAMLCESGVIDARRSTVAHFDHRLRGEEAAAGDLSAVTTLCERYGLALIEGAWAAPRSGEAAARDARYAFLRETAARAGRDIIVTGHTADDQAETVLMHAMRGAGLHGLRGMAPETVVTGVIIARPALCLTRADTHAYCEATDLAFVDDATNNDRTFTRNRVRLDVLPQHPDARDLARTSLLRIADHARRTAALLDAEAAPAIIHVGSSAVRLSRATLRQLGPAIAAHAFRAAIVQLVGNVRDIDRRHYAVLASAIEARTGNAFELPRGIIVTVDSRDLLLTVGAPMAPVIDAAFAAPLPFAGTIGGWHIDVSRSAPGGPQLRFPPTAVVRGRRPGDRMHLRGGTKKLQDLLIDLKVPRRDRDGVPVVASGSDVLWTPLRAAEPSSNEPTDAGESWSIHAVPVA